MSITVVWHGHACFEIKDSLVIVTDPHDGHSIGLKPPSAKADLVLISHRHFDHADGLKYVKRDGATVIDKPGTYEVKGVKIIGIATYHDESRGAKRGSNTAYTFELNGIRFTHLGDLGHVISRDQANVLKPVDILMIPVGGVFTIDAKQADEVVRLLSPKLVIPMHYKIPGLNLPIAGIDEFISGKSNVERLRSNIYTITREAIPKELKIIVLSPP
ncbi:MAG: MBL fold metallo-hydrolase [Candidatus Nezhaarchaeota archaeon]|nr:MBL fold metallo-hydrolase [Candidatus Nezhaarchaeota archaeon]MCX8141484.1 MBL fold metallo-hydrolase [Candidatus Nezhaarchaeota archaeon]MDW8049750.1 MBL fold metallo-hydrolase [Nitrososphaerota archaeon]